MVMVLCMDNTTRNALATVHSMSRADLADLLWSITPAGHRRIYLERGGERCVMGWIDDATDAEVWISLNTISRAILEHLTVAHVARTAA